MNAPAIPPCGTAQEGERCVRRPPELRLALQDLATEIAALAERQEHLGPPERLS